MTNIENALVQDVCVIMDPKALAYNRLKLANLDVDAYAGCLNVLVCSFYRYEKNCSFIGPALSRDMRGTLSLKDTRF